MERIVVIGASAGGIPAIEAICAELPPDFAACVLIVMHVPPQGNDLLERLGKCARLPASYAADGQLAQAGQILVAAPGKNIIVTADGQQVRVQLTTDGHPLLVQPAIDPLFLSAARSLQQRVIGVILSGFLDDGVAGLQAIKNAGGTVIAQDPADALHPDMPANAIRDVAVDFILRAESIGPAVNALVVSGRMMAPQPQPQPQPEADPSGERTVAGGFVPLTI